MNKSTTGKIVVSFLAVAVAFAVSAGEATWTGASTEGPDWSDTANWSDTTPPTSADKATFPLAEQTVRLDGDYAVTDFSVAADASALFYNDDTTRTNTLTITELDTIGETGAQIKLSGPVQVNIGDAGNRINKASIIVSNGAAFVATQLDNGTYNGQKLIAQGTNSKIELDSLVLSTASGANKNETLEAYDGGSITVTSLPNKKPKSAYTVVATNGSSIVASGLSLEDNLVHKVMCEDSQITISQLSGSADKTEYTVGGTGFLSLGYFNLASSANRRFQQLWLYGKDPRIEVTGTSVMGAVFGNSGYPGCGSFNLVPEPAWKESVARITRTATRNNDCKFILRSGVNFKIDCSGFANYYGKRRMMLFQQKRPSWCSDIKLPTDDYVSFSGEGKECCEVSFSTNTATGGFYMTMVSTNAVPPANAVAGVNNIGKDTLFFPTLAEAIQTAAAADDEEVDIVLTRSASIDVLENPGSKPVKIYALRPVHLSTVSGEAGAGIVIGENVTLRKRQGLVLLLR